jgi:hypothetical protein
VSELPTWVPPIVATGSSSLPLYPTPQATWCATQQGGAAGRTGKIRPSLEHMARLGLRPTPTARDGKGESGRSLKGERIHLSGAVRRWPTPTVSDAKPSGSQTFEPKRQGGHKLCEAVRHGEVGKLNPEWVEWLMGWPLGWTDCVPSAMVSFPNKPPSHFPNLRATCCG